MNEMEESTASGTVASCSECSLQDVIIKKARKSYCRNCWKYRCEFQFRKRLFEFGRPAKGTTGEVFRPAEQVLICYDGSPTSVALINLALNALTFTHQNQNDGPTANLPFPFRFSIFVILESELNGSPGVDGRQKKHLQSLLEWTKYAAEKSNGVHFPLLTSCLEMALREFHNESNGMRLNEVPIVLRLNATRNDECPQVEYEPIQDLRLTPIESLDLPFSETLDEHLMELRKSLKTKTEDKDFITILKKNLVHTVANELKVSKILLPEDQTSLAVKMFSMMSLGRGGQVADEMSFNSTIEGGIVLARPLIDVSDDDMRAYLETLTEQATKGIVNKASKMRKMKIDSVERQCDDFIVNLQKGYPATVSTLTRIGSKLESSSSSNIEGDEVASCNQCQFCKRQLDSTVVLENGCLCYGCQHFLNDAHPDKKQYFRNLLLLKQETSSATS